MAKKRHRKHCGWQPKRKKGGSRGVVSMAGCIEGAVDVLAVSVAAAAFGALLTALWITGTYLYALRALGSRKPAVAQSRVPRNAAEAPSFATAWRMAWQAMRHWRWLWLRLAAIWLWLMQAEIAK